MQSLFHLAVNVTDLATTRDFYGGVLGCREGRSASTWVDFDFFGHQLSLHLGPPMATADTGKVGAHEVPTPHFGAVLPVSDWRALARRLRGAGVTFLLEPQDRFAGRPGAQSTMFLRDPSGNALEFKCFDGDGTAFAA